jgi:hypothetical protein
MDNYGSDSIEPTEFSLKHYRQGGTQGAAPVAVPREENAEPLDLTNPFEAALDDVAWASLSSEIKEAVTSPQSAPRPVISLEIEEPEEDVDDLVNWLSEQSWSSFAQSLVSQVRSGKPLSDRQIASAESMRLKCENRAARRAEENAIRDSQEERAAELRHEIGSLEANRIYKTRSGKTYQVVAAKSGGNLYAKILDPKTGRFEYAPGAIRELDADGSRQVIGIKEAVDFGMKFGTCICCGRGLAAKKSVEAGIGPICRDKWGL